MRHILNARVYDIAVRPPADSNMTLLQLTASPAFVQTISAALTKARVLDQTISAALTKARVLVQTISAALTKAKVLIQTISAALTKARVLVSLFWRHNSPLICGLEQVLMSSQCCWHRSRHRWKKQRS